MIIRYKWDKEYDCYMVNHKRFCCDEAKEAWNESAIGFGEYDFCPTKKEQTYVYIYSCLPFPEGAAWDSYKINYCPFCSTKIDVAEYNELLSTIEELTEKTPKI